MKRLAPFFFIRLLLILFSAVVGGFLGFNIYQKYSLDVGNYPDQEEQLENVVDNEKKDEESISQDRVEIVSKPVNDFGWKVLTTLAESEDQIFFSPSILFDQISLLSRGAEGNTLAELTRLLGFTNQEEYEMFLQFRSEQSKEDLFTKQLEVWLPTPIEFSNAFRDVAEYRYNSNLLSFDPLDKASLSQFILEDDEIEAELAKLSLQELVLSKASIDLRIEDTSDQALILSMGDQDYQVYYYPVGQSREYSMYLVQHLQVSQALSIAQDLNFTQLQNEMPVESKGLSLPKINLTKSVNLSPVIKQLGSQNLSFSNDANFELIKKAKLGPKLKLGLVVQTLTVSTNWQESQSTSDRSLVKAPFVLVLIKNDTQEIILLGLVGE